FNYTGTSSPSTGSNTTPLSLVPGAVHSAPGYGVGGDLVGHALYGIDRSFNNSSSTGMGSSGTGGRATQPDNNSIDSLMSMTLSGWFKTESAAINNFARIFAKSAGTTGFELIAGNNPGELRLAVQGINGFQSTTGYDDINTWVFFAVT